MEIDVDRRTSAHTTGHSRSVRLLALFVAMTLAFVCFFHAPAAAQSVWIQGGTSTMMKASGGEMSYKWGGVGGFLSLGYSNQLDLGAYAGFKLHGYTLGLGDRYQPFTLLTDNFDNARFLYGRGAFVSRDYEHQSWMAFGGTTSLQTGAILYRSYRADEPTGAFFYSNKLSKSWELQSTSIVQDGITSLHSLRFTAPKNFDIAATTGVSDNSAYAALSSDYKTKYIQANASYIAAGDDFHSVSGSGMSMPERIDGNLRVRLMPVKYFNVTFEHGAYQLPETESTLGTRKSTLDSTMFAAGVKGFSLSAALTSSESGQLWTRSQSYTVTRNVFGDLLSLSGTAMRQKSSGGLDSKIYLASAQEKISPRLRLTENYSRSGGTNTITGGGQFVSNVMTVGVNHQIIYTPLAGMSSNIVSAWTLNFNVRVWDALRLHGDSYIDPNGKIRYTAGLEGIHFGRTGENDERATRSVSPNFGKFVVKGLVLDEKGAPVWGIAVQVDGRIAYTDTTGRFLIRFRRGETYPITLLAEQSLSSLLYQGVEVPVSARAETENVAPTLTIRVRRAPVQPNAPPVRRKHADLEDSPEREGEKQPVPAESN